MKKEHKKLSDGMMNTLKEISEFQARYFSALETMPALAKLKTYKDCEKGTAMNTMPSALQLQEHPTNKALLETMLFTSFLTQMQVIKDCHTDLDELAHKLTVINAFIAGLFTEPEAMLDMVREQCSVEVKEESNESTDRTLHDTN